MQLEDFEPSFIQALKRIYKVKKLQSNLRISDVLPGSEPHPGARSEADPGGEERLTGLEVSQGQARGQHSDLAVVVDTQQMSIRVRTPCKEIEDKGTNMIRSD